MTPGSASRLRVQAWRDPRLLLGILLVLGSAVGGARLVASYDDSERFWVLRSDVTAGDPVNREDLTVADVRIGEATAAGYLRADEQFPSALGDLVWAHDLAAGALLARTALRAQAATAGVELPLSVTAGSFPLDLVHGDRVDVWVGPGPGGDTASEAIRLLAAAMVLDTGGTGDGGPGRTIVVDAGEGTLDGRDLAAVAAGHVTLVRVP